MGQGRDSLEGDRDGLTCDFDLLSWPGHVDEVVQEDDLLVSRKPACGHCTRAFLQSQLLVVSIDCLGDIDL